MSLALALTLVAGCRTGAKHGPRGSGEPVVEAPAGGAAGSRTAVESPASEAGTGTGEGESETGSSSLEAGVDGELNSAEALIAAADRLRAVALVNTDNRRVEGRMNTRQLEMLRGVLASARVEEDFASTPPPLSVSLRIEVDGRSAPFIAHLVGAERLRLNPERPWSIEPFGAARDIHVGPKVLEAIQRTRSGEPAKEHRLPNDAPDI